MGAQDLYKLFIDTGAFIALIDERDSLHQASRAFYASLSKRTNLITSIMVVAETYTWLRYHAGSDLAIRFLDIIDRSEKAGVLQVILPGNDIRDKVHAVLKKYNDQNLSYTDAVSFIILETMNIQDVFGFDSHFYIIKRNLWPSVKPATP
ncbi:MAG: type II toxin-antitoxin system VapC family toxin [Moorellaceae bacterium]